MKSFFQLLLIAIIVIIAFFFYKKYFVDEVISKNNNTEQTILPTENYEKKEIPSTFYIHSWELTPEFMPKIKLPFKENFVTFHNVKNAYSRMESLLQEFEFSSFDNFFQNTPKKFSSII